MTTQTTVDVQVPEARTEGGFFISRLDALMPEGVRWSEPEGGPTLWLELPAHIDVSALETRLARRGVGIVPQTDAFATDTAHLNGFAISFALHSEAVMDQALRVLADELTKMV